MCIRDRLGVLCDAHLLLDPKILKLLVLGIVALLLSGIGGIIGGYIMYIIKRGNYNPVIGIAAVSYTHLDVYKRQF